MRWLGLLGVICVVAGVGCQFSPTRTCSKDGDCRGGGVCDPTHKICVVSSDGGGGDAGDAGDDAGVLCPSGCASFEECIDGACAPRYERVVVDEPAAGAFVGPDGVVVSARLVLAQGRAPADPAFLVLTTEGPGDGGVTQLVKDGGAYVGQWPGSEVDGTYSLMAAHPGSALLRSDPVSVVVDRTPPMFSMEIPSATRLDGGATDYTDPEPGYEAAHRRDEVVTMTVKVKEDHLSPSSVTVRVTGIADGGMPGAVETLAWSPQWVDCGNERCASLEVDLAAPQMDAFRGTFEVTIDGADLAGNTASASEGVKVTRWKWSHPFSPTETSPAVGGRGTIYVGANGLHAISPEGVPQWSFDGGAVTATPSVGRVDGGADRVYVAVKSGTLASLIAVEGGTEISRCGPYSSNGTIRGSVFVTIADGGVGGWEAAAAVLSADTDSRMLALRPEDAIGTCVPSSSTTQEMAENSALSGRGADVFYGDKLGNIQSWQLAGWTQRSGWPVGTGGLYARSLAVVGTNIVGGGGGPGTGGVFSIHYNGNAAGPNWKFPVGSSTPAWHPSIGSGDYVYFGNDQSILTRVMLGANAGAQTTNTPKPVFGAPLVGEGSVVYSAVSLSGEIQAWTSDLRPLWAVKVEGGVVASLNLDCSRNGAGLKLNGRPGVLYVLSDQGTLYSFVVDSRGIDTTAPWPKFLHDPRNTGNADTPLDEFSCP